jgi:hypothetical protein
MQKIRSIWKTKEEVLRTYPNVQFIDYFFTQHTNYPPVWYCCSSCSKCCNTLKSLKPNPSRYGYMLCDSCALISINKPETLLKTREQVRKMCPNSQFVNNRHLQHLDHPPVWTSCSSCSKCAPKYGPYKFKLCWQFGSYLCHGCTVCPSCKKLGLTTCKFI